MAVKLSDILDAQDLEREIGAGYVNRRFHPEFPELAIVNYSDRCQFDGHWTETTRATRGIIYDTGSGEVLARPFGKMFNWSDEANRPADVNPDAPIAGAFNKWDGSLGIGYMRPDGRPAIATRGSFSSEQAIHATAGLSLLHKLVIDGDRLTGHTTLWEIIYPENRIVLDYRDQDEIVCLGTMDNATGVFAPQRTSSDDFPDAGLGYTLRDVLALPPRSNAEGYVVWLDARTAVKLKQADYLALHRVVSNLTVKEVWRQLRAGTFDAFAEALPDEFHGWARDARGGLIGRFNRIRLDAMRALEDLPDESRKDQAAWIARNVPAAERGLVFGLLDGKNVSDAVWRMLEPKGSEPARIAA